MKTKEIHTMLGVAPATFFDWNKPTSKKQNLAKLLKALDSGTVNAMLKKAKQAPKKPTMLLYTVNQSIGDRARHFNLTALKKLFYKKEPLTRYEKYALKVIKKEALPVEVEEFLAYYKIPTKRVEKVLEAC